MKNTYRRLLALILAGVICLSAMPFVFAASIRGDANFDGQTNSTDALVILRYSVGKKVDGFNEYLFDVNGDYAVNSTDALRVLQMTVGKDDPTKYGYKEVLKFYADALYSSYMQTTAVEYTYDMTYKIGRWAKPDDGNPDAYQSYPVQLYDSDTIRFKNGRNEEGKTPYDCFVEPWIHEDASADVYVTKNTTGYEVVINLKEDRISDFEYISSNDFIAPYTGFEFSYGRPGVDEVWGEGRSISLNYGVITAQINSDGCVEEVNYRVPFNGSMYLVSENNAQRLAVDVYDGEYQYTLSFKY